MPENFCKEYYAGMVHFFRPKRQKKKGSTFAVCEISGDCLSSLFPFEKMRRDMQRLLEQAGNVRPPGLGPWTRQWLPRCNIYEGSEYFTVLVDLAGVKKEELEILADTRTLYFRGEREEPVPKSTERCHQLEIYFGPFERAISFTEPIEPEQVRVDYRDGWLEIRLPKIPRVKVPIETKEENE